MCILSTAHIESVKDLLDFANGVVESRPYRDEVAAGRIAELEKDLQVCCDSLSSTGLEALQGLLDKLKEERSLDHSLTFLYRETPDGRVPSWDTGEEVRWDRRETAAEFVAKVSGGDPEDLNWLQPLEIRLDLI